VKCNTHGASIGNPGPTACACIFRNNHGESKGGFAANLGIANALFEEIMGVILAIEIAYYGNWDHLWIESDSKLATLALKSPIIVPWELKNRWLNCMRKLNSMQFILTHIYREDNHYADKLANLRLTVTNFIWWQSPLVVIREDLVRNRLGLPNFRFC